jgi:hypothetical protein
LAAPIDGGMRRLLPVILVCALAFVAAGCGMGGSGSDSPGAPEPGELALDAFRAAQRAGTVHYSVQATLEGEGTGPMRLAVDGDLGEGEGRADVSFEGNGQSLAGTLLYDRGGFFVKFLGKWYGRESPLGPTDELERVLGTEERFAARFDDLFEGTVSEGPVADGVTTWAYNGRLNIDGIMELIAQEGQVDEDAREKLEKLAESTRFTLLVGQADLLPRAFLLDLTGEGADLGGFAGPNAGEVRFTLRGSFSRWGAPVTITPPSSYAPLEDLLSQFFSF